MSGIFSHCSACASYNDYPSSLLGKKKSRLPLGTSFYAWSMQVIQRRPILLLVEGERDGQGEDCSLQLWELVLVRAKLLQACPTLCDPKDCSPPGSSVPGILQARILEWVVISFSTWSNWQSLPWSTEWSRAKVNRVLLRECTDHSKHPLP